MFERADVGRPDDAGDGEDAQFGVDADFLRAVDHQIAVGQHLGDDGGDRQVDAFRTRRRAVPSVSVSDEMSPSTLAEEPSPSTSNEPPSPSVRLAVRLRCDSFLSLARSLIEISTVRMSPASQRARVGEQPALAVVPQRELLDRTGRLLRIAVDRVPIRREARADRRERRRHADLLEGGRTAAGEQGETDDGEEPADHDGSSLRVALAMTPVMVAAALLSISLRIVLAWRGSSFMRMPAASSILTSASRSAAASGFILA